MDLRELEVPIVQAPLGGGPSTPALAAAVASAGAMGFLAAGYKRAEFVREEIAELRSRSDAPFGVNVFAPPGDAIDEGALQAYAARLRGEAERYGLKLGEPRHDDDDFAAKLEVAIAERVPVVSFTFGCPEPGIVERLHDGGCDVWVTVTSPEEALQAAGVGADALVVQGYEAGGHRAYFSDDGEHEDLGLLAALRLVSNSVRVPLVAAGGIGDGASVAAVLCAGALAAQVGTALMLSDEAGTSAPHRAALRAGGPSALTRAFSGRQARGIVNRFMREHGEQAPSAYPDVHHLTTPLRAAARAAGDEETINLWAGQARALAEEGPAAEIVRRMAREAHDAAAQLGRRLG